MGRGRVRALVARELRAQAEGAAAGAGVRALARVHGAVRAQLGRAPEGGAAAHAAQRARPVRARVHAQRRARLGRRAAPLAHELAQLRVRPGVVLQVRAPRERLLACRARERPLPRVQRADVSREVAAVGEGAPARVAAVPLLAVVQPLVSPPGHHRHAFIALLAPHGPPRVGGDGRRRRSIFFRRSDAVVVAFLDLYLRERPARERIGSRNKTCRSVSRVYFDRPRSSL